MTRHQLSVAVMTLLLNTLAVLNFRALGAAMAEIVRDVGGSTDQELWLPDAYLTALIVATPIAAALAIRFGAHKLLLACVLGLTTASVLTGTATDIGSVAALLFLQGLCAGPILPTTQSVIVTAFPGTQRGTGMAIWNAGSVLGVLIGSLLGGYLIENFHWRSVFLVGIPFALAAIPLVVRTLPHGAGNVEHRIDFVAVALLAAGLTALGGFVNLFDDAAEVGGTGTLVALAAVAVVGLALFWLRNARSANPILVLGVLRDRQLAVASALVLGAAALNIGLLETEALTEIMSFDAEAVGTNGAIRALSFLVGVALGAPLLRMIGSRTAILLALTGVAVGKFGTTLYAADTGFIAAMWPAAVSQAAFGMLGTVLAVVAFQTVDPLLVIRAAGLFVFARVFGNAIGLAVANTARVLRQQHLVADGIAAAAATVSSFVQVFWAGLLLTIALMPLTALLRSRRATLEPPTAA